MTERAAASWRGRRVLVTGHTGFKGSWLVLLLRAMGAQVTGLALPPPPGRSLFVEAGAAEGLDHHEVDIRDEAATARAVRDAKPDVVFHLAAQSLVRRGYAEPVATWQCNVLGTLHVLEAIRATPSVKAAVIVTTDKVYRDPDGQAFAEGAPLGGADPYSASKAAAELVVESARSSWAAARGLGLATARAGNTVGGGDWAEDRIVPDCVRAVATSSPVRIRKPDSVRPWSHVLDILAGYGLLATRLLDDPTRFSGAWNFGPQAGGEPTALDVARLVLAAFDRLDLLHVMPNPDDPHEAALLRLDASRARTDLGWTPRFDPHSALADAAAFYAATTDPAATRAAVVAALHRIGPAGAA